MIQKESILYVMDNSGANKALAIHIYNGYKRRYAKPGDLIKVTIKSIRKKSVKSLKVKKGDLSKGVVTSTKSFNRKIDGELKCNNKNSVVLISNQNKYLSSKVGISADADIFRHTKYCKLLRMTRRVKINA